MSTPFTARLRQGEVLLGPLVTLGSTDVAEILSQVGFDWLWFEMEHAPLGLSRVQEMIQAVGGRCPCLVRAPWNDAVWIKRVLDTGCDGIVIPQIRTAVEAREAIRACHYPPAGTRSVGIARAQGYGMSLQEHIEHAGERLTVVLQIEHADAVANIEAILEVPGIDAVLIGPYDLSGSMGLTGQVTHPEVQAAIEKVQAACRAREVPIGIFAADTAAARQRIESGFTLIALSVDTMYLWRAAKEAVAELHGRR